MIQIYKHCLDGNLQEPVNIFFPCTIASAKGCVFHANDSMSLNHDLLKENAGVNLTSMKTTFVNISQSKHTAAILITVLIMKPHPHSLYMLSQLSEPLFQDKFLYIFFWWTVTETFPQKPMDGFSFIQIQFSEFALWNWHRVMDKLLFTF